MPESLARSGFRGGRVAGRGALRAAAVGALLLAVAGCSGSPSGPAAPRAPKPVVQQAEPTALRASPPVTALLFTPAQRGTLAQQKLAVACMAARGFRYAPVPPPRTPDGAGQRADQRADQLPRPFGLESAEAPKQPAAVPSETPPKPGSPESSDAYATALFGRESARVTAKGARLSVSRPGEGCLAEAEERLFGDGRMRRLQLRILLFEAQENARREVEKDPAFQAVTARWRQCMDAAKVRAKDPVQVAGTLTSGKDPGTSPVAAADLRCKAETGYLTTAYQRLAAVQRDWLDRHPDVGADWRKLSARESKAVGEVLGGTG
ncbi:hypothetical protein [Streptomyces sp. NPDC090025]|uniref:hypothetical protein n=1 Tax=Streptomyces sp. NPDC090025 TaxID=3365922 RepID=UPI00383631A6